MCSALESGKTDRGTVSEPAPPAEMVNQSQLALSTGLMTNEAAWHTACSAKLAAQKHVFQRSEEWSLRKPSFLALTWHV